VRALRTDGKSAQQVADTAEPALAAGEALIQPTKVLFTAADVAAVAADRRGFVGTLGHLFTGIVRQISLPADAPTALSARRGFLGRRVVCTPVVSCGNCDLCRSGLPAHCRSRQVAGIVGRDGGCADLVAMPLANLHALPDGLSDDRAVFAPLAASVLHTAHMLRAESKRFVTILGDSLLALLAAQCLVARNKTVRVLTDNADAGRLCEQWGVKHRSPADPGRRQDQDAVVDCTGNAAGLKLAMQLAKPRGTIMLKSAVADLPFPAGRPFPEAGGAWAGGLDLTPIVANELHLIGSREGPLSEALAELAAGRIETSALVGKRYRMDQAMQALAAAASDGPLAILVEDMGKSLARAA
jgi:alcohol dehydrogenase